MIAFRNSLVFMSLAVAFGFFVLFHEYIEDKDFAKIEFRSRAVESLIEKSFNQNLEVIYSIQNLFFTGRDISRQEFKDFVANSLLRHPGLQAIEHMIRVNDSDRARYETKMQKEGFLYFSIKEFSPTGMLVPASRRDHYHVINYVEPLQQNIAALGYDVSQTPAANEALMIAETKGIGISPWLTLAQGDLGFVVYLSIEKTDGIAVGVFKLKKFIETALSTSQSDGIDFIMEEISDQPTTSRVLKYDSQENKIINYIEAGVPADEELTSVNLMKIGQRTWRITHFPSPQYKSVIHPSIPYVAALIVLLLMLSITFLLDERDARVAAQSATRVREEFMTVASHELRTPLTPLKMEIFLVKELILAGQVSQDKIIGILDNANKHLNHIVGLIDDLLDVGRIGEDRYKYNFSDFNIDELVRQTVEKFEPIFKANNCQVRLNLQNEVQVHWDAQRIEQVLTNCLSNAVKFANNGLIEINLRTENQYVIFSVKDNGIGISEEFQKKMFNKFERGVSTQSYGGLGLGLYIVREIVKAHGGTVHVNSQLGFGAEFVFQVPRHV